MQTEGAPNLVAMFLAEAARQGEAPFLWAKREDAYAALSWRATAGRAAALARGLGALGIVPGDRVLLASENRPEWLIADLAIMGAGAITVPTYTTNQMADHRHVLTDSGAKAAIVSTAALTRDVLAAAQGTPELDLIIAMEPPELAQDVGVAVRDWDTVLAEYAASPEDLAEAVGGVTRTETACIIYTSGTGGVPKGVMLSHGAILSNCEGARGMLEEMDLGDEVFLSFLPLSHSYEHTAGQFLPIFIGAQIYYAEGMDRLSANMAEARPTIMTAVPRLYEVMHGGILRNLHRRGGLAEKLFNRAVALGRRRYEQPGSLGPLETITNGALDVLVRAKVRRGFGGRLKAFVSGGAPLNYDVGVFFTALGIRLLQGYGQTESAPVVSCNRPGHNRIDTVGPPLDGVEVRIDDDGEILVRGELVMQGYWRNPEATAETIRDGWLHTGDIGELDGDGHLRITDRKKDIIVSSGGDNISPQRIEGLLTLRPEIAQAMAHGDGRPHLVALIIPDESFVREWAAENAADAGLADLIEDPRFRQRMGEAVDKVNETLSVVERIRRFTLAATPFSVADGTLTPTMKIRRHEIIARHGEALAALYGS